MDSDPLNSNRSFRVQRIINFQLNKENNMGNLQERTPQRIGLESRGYNSEYPEGWDTPEENKTIILTKQEKRVLSLLALFVDNFGHKEVDELTKSNWVRGIQKLSDREIDTAITRCLHELHYFPKVSEFMERTKDPSQARNQEDDRLALPEPKRHPIPMPPEFKAKMQELFKTTKPKR